MTNPWFSIPLADYEAHMESAAVQQATMLRTVLRKAVDLYRPRSLAILGVAGGNGLSELRSSNVEAVIAVDLNPEYLATCRSRYGAEAWSLDTVQWDLSDSRPPIECVDLVFAALVIEYIDRATFTAYAPSLLRDAGHLLMVFQDADSKQSPVTPAGIHSLRRLEAIHRTANIDQITANLCGTGGGLVLEESVALSSSAGKRFSMRVMRRPPTLLEVKS